LILYKGKIPILIVERLNNQDENLKNVIDVIKNLIARLDVKIKCVIKQTARSEKVAGQF